MRQTLIVGLLVAVAFAGCTGDAADEEPIVEEPQGDADDLPLVNTPPTAILAAALQNGTAPLLVNFTINATDLDGDNMTWTLSYQPMANATLGNETHIANGTAFPAMANYTFEGGLWNVTLAVTDGMNTTWSHLEINVTAMVASAPREPILLHSVSNRGLVGGPYLLTNDPDMAHQCPGFNVGQDGRGCVFLQFPAGEFEGLPAIVTTDAGNFRMAFWTECHGVTGSGYAFVAGGSGDQITMPNAGGTCAVVWTSTLGNWGSERTFTVDIYDWLAE